jgi:hypothetical protein
VSQAGDHDDDAGTGAPEQRFGERKTSLNDRRRDREKKLKSQIQALEAEVEEVKSTEDAKLYGLAPEVERAVTRAIHEGNGRCLYRLIRPLHSADFADLI